jgi:hypothetical protein
MKSIPLSQLRDLLKSASIREVENLKAWHGDQNPQIAELRAKSQGRLEAWLAVRDALAGNTVNLRISAQGFD